MKKILAVASLALFVSLPALAHVSIQEKAAPAGSYQKLTFKVGHGCGESPTNSITLQLPEDIRGAKPMPKSGWTLEIKRDKLSKPYTSHDKTIEEDVRTITWSGGKLPNEQYDEFVISAKMGDEAKVVAIPVVQVCDEGKTEWTEVAAAGAPEPEHPAPTIEITAAAADEHAGHGMMHDPAKK